MSVKPHTNIDKWIASAVAGLTFAALSWPVLYRIEQRVLGVKLLTGDECPRLTALLLNALLFTVALRAAMGSSEGVLHRNKDKWIIAFIGGLLFVLFSSPIAYQVTNNLMSILGIPIAGDDGCPYASGVALHTVLFTLTVRALIR